MEWHTSGWPELGKPVLLTYNMGWPAPIICYATFEDTGEGVGPVDQHGDELEFGPDTEYAWAEFAMPRKLGRWGDNPMEE